MTRHAYSSGALALLCLIASSHLAACSGGDTTQTEDMKTSPGMDSAPDASPMPQEEMGADAAEDLDGIDADEDLGADMGDMTVLTGDPCQSDDDCDAQTNQVCVPSGVCAPLPSCDKSSRVNQCKRDLGALGFGEQELDRAFCLASQGVCTFGCVRDSECPGDEICADDGLCAPFTGTITGIDPGGDATAPFKAGVGNALMHFPIGLSLGGYGTRAGDDGGRYSEALESSHGEMHGLYARAVLLDSGDRQIMLIRMPIIFPTAPMVEMIARALQEKTGRDWRDSLVVSGTHTHSGPGRFLHLPPPDDAVLPLGAFGTDNFHDQAFSWIVDSAVEAANLALDDLSDAKFGWEIVESFDRDDQIASDRWGATPPFDDNRILLMRIDDLDDQPRALLFSFGMHGTYFDEGYASGDAPAGIERALETRFGEEYDRFVPTLFFNQNGGTMSPRGDRNGHRDNQKFEHIGYRFVEKMWDEIEDVATDREVSLDGKTLRFPLGFDALGYEDGDFTQLLFIEGNLKYGGLQCDVAGGEDDDYTTYQEPGTTKCIGIDYTMYNRPPTLFLRSQMTALSIDGLTIVTLPGEAAMELGWQVIRDVSAAHGLDRFKLWTWGYAQDHQFYLTPSNLRGELPPWPGISTPMAPDDYPDYAFSYYQGGYEAGFTIWGPRMGDYLVERAIDATGKLLGEPLNLPYEEPMPTQYSRRGNTLFPVEQTPASIVGDVTQDVPAMVQRHEAIEFAWIGGDPGAEMPQAPHVILEMQQPNDAFAPVMHKNRRPYDNREHLMLTRVRPDQEGGRREWVVYWEELKDFPTGTYRFRVEGHRLDELSQRVPYSVTSSAFTLHPSQDIELTEVSLDATNTLTGRISYAATPSISRKPVGNADPAAVEGSYRMRHPDVPSGEPTPVIPDEDLLASQVTILIAQGGTTIDEVSADTITMSPEALGGRMIPVTRFALDMSGYDAGTYEVTITLTDLYGNTGTMTTSITKS